MAASAMDAQQLHSAFELFNRQSDLLEQSYRELTDKVERLTDELNEARSARLIELVEKERLSQRLALLLETLPGAIVVIDGNGVIQQQNSEAVRLLNEPLNGCSWANIVRREVRKGGSKDGNIQLRDGRWLSLSRRPLKDEPGEILLLADVTDSRRMTELRQRQERLTAIGEMTAEFAHQVRTPLASAMLYAAQIDRTSEAQARVADKVVERLNDLGRMVNDMLGFAKGGHRAEEDVDVRDLFLDIRATLRPQLGERTTLDLLIDGTSVDRGDANAFVIAANSDALKGALINLIMNSSQAADGHAHIQLGAWRDDDWIFFTVTDDGPGIEADVMPHLFEPFFTTRPQGTGLGLAVVQDVARSHGGDVRAESLRRGARFTLRLPAADAGGSHD